MQLPIVTLKLYVDTISVQLHKRCENRPYGLENKTAVKWFSWLSVLLSAVIVFLWWFVGRRHDSESMDIADCCRVYALNSTCSALVKTRRKNIGKAVFYNNVMFSGGAPVKLGCIRKMYQLWTIMSHFGQRKLSKFGTNYIESVWKNTILARCTPSPYYYQL